MAAETSAQQNEGHEPGWKERLGGAWNAARALLSTRIEIFREELAEKGSLLGRGAIGLAVALVFGWVAVLLFTALAATLLAKLLGSLWAGLLACFLLYALIHCIAGWIGWKALSRVRPFQFPATRDEIRKDWAALRLSGRAAGEADEPAPFDSDPEADLEERFREGSE